MSCPSAPQSVRDSARKSSETDSETSPDSSAAAVLSEDGSELQVRDSNPGQPSSQNNLREQNQSYLASENDREPADSILIFVDTDLRLQRFTSNTMELFGLRDRDRGRPVATIAARLNCPELKVLARDVLDSGRSLATHIALEDGRRYQLCIKPDLRAADQLEGLIISLEEIIGGVQGELPSIARLTATPLMNILHEPVVVLSENLYIQFANAAFYGFFNYSNAPIERQSILQIGEGEWDCDIFRDLMRSVKQEDGRTECAELPLRFSALGKPTLSLRAHYLKNEKLIVLALRDITALREVKELRQRAAVLNEEVDVRRRLQEMAAAVLQAGSLHEMCNLALGGILELTGADFASLQIINQQIEIELASQRGLDKDQLRTLLQSAADMDFAFTQVIRQGMQLAVEDLQGRGDEAPQLKRLGFRALRSTPLLGRSGKSFGVLVIAYRQLRSFTARDEHLLKLFALEIADLCEWVRTEKRLRQNEMRLRAQSEQLLANDRQKNQFLGLLGHELRNPLTVMRNAIQTLVSAEQSLLKDDRLTEALVLLERQSRHMTHLVNDLLDVTRINNGKVVLKRERVLLARSLEEVITAHRSTLTTRELIFAVEQGPELLYLDADPARLFQVLDNLLTNAIKFTPTGGQITVSVGRDGEAATIAVRDTGIGIAPESFNSLFRPFSQVDGKLARQGLGLGLSLVKTLVELHGGEIRAFSEGEDKGSEFVIRWPLHEQQDAPAAQAAPVILPKGSGICRRILVVDDIPDIADSFARLLEAAGHEVLVAYEAEQGLMLARQHRPTVAFLDMAMPDMDGLTMGSKLREEFSSAEMTLVVVSGYGQRQDIDQALAAGFDHHLLKPIELQQVDALLDCLPPPR